MTTIDPSDPLVCERLRQVEPALRPLTISGDPSVLRDGRVVVGIVGSRHPRSDSAAHARRIAHDAASAGCVVASGLAMGIDGVAHDAALRAGGDTIAVIAGGLGAVHPVRNRELARRIAGSRTSRGVAPGIHAAARGVVVSEYGGGAEAPHPYQFRERNRIIAGLSDYLVVVQAGHASGSMGTAKAALALGVPIGIVPSAVGDPGYEGGMALIRDGADAVVDGPSLFKRLALHGIVGEAFVAAALGRAHPALLDHPLASFLQQPRTVEELAELAGLPMRDTRRMLAELAEDQLVVATADGAWIDAGAAP